MDNNLEFAKTPLLWDEWFDRVEHEAIPQWNKFVKPYIPSKLGHTLEIAAGGGRFTEILYRMTDSMAAYDMNDYAIKRLKKRFFDGSVAVYKNDGKHLDYTPNESIDFVFSFDSMVHFDKEIVFAYIDEIHRVLKSGGQAFLHLSNLTEGDKEIKNNPHWRALGGMENFVQYCFEKDFKVEVRMLDWIPNNNLDCILLITKL
jgi:SAM-dependent methyltransferase